MLKKTRLFTPGPTPLLPAAQAALARAEIHHRTEEFRALYRQVLEDLRYFYGTKNDVILFTSSGTGAMEAAVSNLLSEGEAVLVATAGKFGERWVEIARAFRLKVDTVEAPYGQAVPAEAVREKLGGGSYAALFVQATESSTGVRHDVQAMAAVAREAGALFIVDAITGLGTMELDVDGWGLDVVVGGSQKALMIPPGLAFASLSPAAWERAELARLPHYYFDFAREKKSAEKGEGAFTPSTALVLALAEALRYIRSVGRESLIANAQLLAEATRQAVRAMGLELFAPAAPCDALTAVRPPEGMDSGVIIRALRERFGAVVANGQGSMKGRMFRVAHLGNYDFPDLAGLLAALELVLTELGHPCELGAGVRAAERVYVEQGPKSKVQSPKSLAAR